MSEKIRLTAQVSNRFSNEEDSGTVRFCPKCGRAIPLDQQQCVFCANTGEIPRPRLRTKHKLLIMVIILAVLLALLLGMRLFSPQPITPTTLPTSIIRGTSVPVTVLP